MMKSFKVNTKSIILLGFTLPMLLLSNCADDQRKPPIFKVTEPLMQFPFQINQPDQVYELPPILEEISGLTLNEKGELLCVQDEEGLIFVFDLKKGEVINEVSFGSAGDYEGIEAVGTTVFVLNSEGEIFEVEQFGTEFQKTTIHETKLHKGYDTEGLCYSSSENQLLIACKEKAGKGEQYENAKTIYAFDLEKKKRKKQPKFTLFKSDLYFFIQKYKLENLQFDPSGSMPFRPSGVAIDPLTHYHYIISSKEPMLIVLDEVGRLMHIEALDSKIYRQAEGITFDAQGNLYLSSEGKGGVGKIFYLTRK